jgi:hypothetical protein
MVMILKDSGHCGIILMANFPLFLKRNLLVLDKSILLSKNLKFLSIGPIMNRLDISENFASMHTSRYVI